MLSAVVKHFTNAQAAGTHVDEELQER